MRLYIIAAPPYLVDSGNPSANDSARDHLLGRHVRRGGGTGTADALPVSDDAIIGGDTFDGLIRFARESGWTVIEAMQHANEMECMRRLAGRVPPVLSELRVWFFENSCPWNLT